MSLGVIMLIHDSFARAEQVLRHWSGAGCPVVVHVDRRVKLETYARFCANVGDLPNVRFARRHRCEWGGWGLVKATLATSALMLEEFPDTSHVILTSGACLPLRPVSELRAYLQARPRTDFIESANIEDVPWAVGGLNEERFTLRFPFSWKRQRRLFDRYVRLQRRLKFSRKIPDGLVPHMGSQWWCLTRETLAAILNDPERPRYDRYFRRVWIPDESYFQTLARLYSTRIVSRSLTLAQFDHQGRPHVLYDDHLQLLRRTDCFVARKVWHKADLLYETFLTDATHAVTPAEPNPAKIDQMFSKARERRIHGRRGLYMQSRLPREGREHGFSADRYSVFEGFDAVFSDFPEWLSAMECGTVHGHLFAPQSVEFAGGQALYAGGLTASPAIRDLGPVRFLTSLIWNTQGTRQCFQFGPADNQKISWPIAKDPYAHISVISGAWVIPLMKQNAPFETLRAEAARLQRLEADHINALNSAYAKARIRIWNLGQFLEAPYELLQTVFDEIDQTTAPRPLTRMPKLAPTEGLAAFLSEMKDQGTHPFLMGTVPARLETPDPSRAIQKPYPVEI